MRRYLAPIIGIVLILLSLGAMSMRHHLGGIPLIPDRSALSWDIELSVKGDSKGAPVTLSVIHPSVRNFFRIVDRAFSSDGYSVSSTRVGPRTTFVFYRKITESGEQRFSVRLKVDKDYSLPLRELNEDQITRFAKKDVVALKELRRKVFASFPRKIAPKELIQSVLSTSPKQFSFLKSRQIKLDALHELGIKSRIYYGFLLREGRVISEFIPFLLAEDGKRSWVYSLNANEFIEKSRVFLWGTSMQPIQKVKGIEELNWTITAVPIRARIPAITGHSNGVLISALRWFSLDKLSISTQHSFKILLLLPIASLVIAFLRNLVGIRTFGTFMPALLALSFRDTGLIVGLFLFCLVVTLGVLLRICFRYFRLLLVPRLTATLTCVVILLFGLSLLGVELNMPALSSLSLFPVVILSMVVERLSVAMEEYGYLAAINLVLMSLLAAVLAYLVITQDMVSYLLTAFPELNLLVLGMAILLGRYFGYRVIELFRFREFANNGKEL